MNQWMKWSFIFLLQFANLFWITLNYMPTSHASYNEYITEKIAESLLKKPNKIVMENYKCIIYPD